MPTTKNGVEFFISQEDEIKISGYGWNLRGNSGYVQAHISGRGTQPLHRFLMDFPEGKTVDHINGNKLDNRRENLRICEHVENCRNRHKVRNRLGFKGVRTQPRGGNYQAYITHNKKLLTLGTFASIEEAARVYDAKAIELFGEYANLNFKEAK